MSNTQRTCSVCRIRGTDAFPFPSAYWDYCPEHGAYARVEHAIGTSLLGDDWLRLMIGRYGHGAA